MATFTFVARPFASLPTNLLHFLRYTLGRLGEPQPNSLVRPHLRDPLLIERHQNEMRTKEGQTGARPFHRSVDHVTWVRATAIDYAVWQRAVFCCDGVRPWGGGATRLLHPGRDTILNKKQGSSPFGNDRGVPAAIQPLDIDA